MKFILMKIALLGYMGSGKSHVCKIIATNYNIPNYDLDQIIEIELNTSIAKIFQEKGEIYFRKMESEILISFMETHSEYILALGGGTPVYSNNMDLLNQNTTTIYLQTSVNQLYERLINQKNNRPIISHLEDNQLKEFIAKHLLERQMYYQQAKYMVNTDDKSGLEVADAILHLLEKGC